MGIAPITATDLRSNLEVTGGAISPYEADAALLASLAYVSEHHRSSGKSTDAPFDWPKSQRDLEIFNEAQAKAIAQLMGEMETNVTKSVTKRRVGHIV
ncbi:MAG: hypothetical protein KBT76_14745 [Sulfitobacter litoralis]|nr:hypothetical protein [Sulfitobacter litoralis]